VLVIAGGRDTKFTEIGHRMAASIPDATFAEIDAAGHAVHVERPAETCAVIVNWLRSRQPPNANPAANNEP
jgi:pimeloyl-ACP methyl ester carboxylesterase